MHISNKEINELKARVQHMMDQPYHSADYYIAVKRFKQEINHLENIAT